MKKSIVFLFLISSLISFHCTLVEKKEIKLDYKPIIDPTVKFGANAALDTLKCLYVDTSESVFKSKTTRYPSNGSPELILKPNSNVWWYTEEGEAIQPFFSFCYGYIRADTTIIKLHKGSYNYSSLVMKIYKDSFWTNYTIYFSDGDRLYSKVTYQSLKLDKQTYKLGDTLSGFLGFKYEIISPAKPTWNANGHFKCVLGRSSKLLDYLSTYKRCTKQEISPPSVY